MRVWPIRGRTGIRRPGWRQCSYYTPCQQKHCKQKWQRRFHQIHNSPIKGCQPIKRGRTQRRSCTTQGKANRFRREPCRNQTWSYNRPKERSGNQRYNNARSTKLKVCRLLRQEPSSPTIRPHADRNKESQAKTTPRFRSLPRQNGQCSERMYQVRPINMRQM